MYFCKNVFTFGEEKSFMRDSFWVCQRATRKTCPFDKYCSGKRTTTNMETSSPGTQVTTVTITGSIDPAGHGADEPTTTVEHNREVGKGDEAAVALLQTRQQHQTFHRMVVVPSNAGRQSALSNKSATSSPSADATSFTLSNDPNSTEYYEFSETTLKRFYGDVTPYGTWAKGESRASLTVPRQEDKKRSLLTSGYDTGTNPRHRSAPVSPIQQSPSASLPTSVYSTLLRPKSSRVQEVLLEDSTITYVDFLPDKVKTRYTRNEYKSFGYEDFLQLVASGPTLSRYNRCSCIGHRAPGGPAPWCLGRWFVLPDSLHLALENSVETVSRCNVFYAVERPQLQLLTKNTLVRTSKFPLER